MLQRHTDGGRREILLPEKTFTVEKKFNYQNDGVYAHSSQEGTEIIPQVERGHHHL
jgi:hypothetical protein